MTNHEMVQEFHRVFGASADAALWMKLIREETEELQAALDAGNMIAAFDGVCDLLYVTYGIGITLGLPVDKGFAEVHRSNMTKAWPDGPHFREDGKLLKGPTYEPPVLGPLIAEGQAEAAAYALALLRGENK